MIVDRVGPGNNHNARDQIVAGNFATQRTDGLAAVEILLGLYFVDAVNARRQTVESVLARFVGGG